MTAGGRWRVRGSSRGPTREPPGPNPLIPRNPRADNAGTMDFLAHIPVRAFWLLTAAGCVVAGAPLYALGQRAFHLRHALAALTERMGGRPSAMASHLFPSFLLKKSWPVPVPT